MPASAVPEIGVRFVGALLALAVSAVHIADQGGMTAFASPDWIGWGYRLIEAGGVLTAVALLMAPMMPGPSRLARPVWSGLARRLGWAAAVLLGTGPFLAYIASRTIGVPGDPGDVGNWGYWVGMVSLFVEAALVALSVSMLLALRHSRRQQAGSSARSQLRPLFVAGQLRPPHRCQPAWLGLSCSPRELSVLRDTGRSRVTAGLPSLPSVCAMDDSGMFGGGRSAESSDGGPSRRTFLSGVVVVGAAVGLSGLAEGAIAAEPALAAPAAPPTGPPTTTIPLPTTTAPEQLWLTWGSNPATDVTVSWLSPGTVPMPAPTLNWSSRPISAHNPGRSVQLPAPRPLDVTQRYPQASSVSFTDGLNAQTTYYYHVELRDLEPGTTYYYQVSDGATPTPATTGASFTTAPAGRAKFRFSSYGDLATPSYDLNASGNQWHESCDNSYYAVSAIENPGDGDGAPLFHLLNGDLCYANLDIFNAPGVWRDFGVNVSRSAKNRPWMPALGNHETEFGTCNHAGQQGDAPGGIAAQGAAGNYWNGPYGYGHYLSRFLLPDNEVTNWDGNRLRGNFYAFQVGTVKFISLDADDVIYQDGASAYLNSAANATPEVTSSGAAIPNGTVTYNHGYTGDLKIVAANNSAVPDFSTGTPNLQCIWLERTLREARQDPSVDMIVVFMHQCAMSTSVPGNGSDLGIRRAWLPLFDKYEVDLVLSGHEHDYERTYPVRGYDAGQLGTVVSPNPDQTAGETVDTRRPHVATTTAVSYSGQQAWDTEQGTVFLVLGGGGTDGPTNTYGVDSANGLPKAKVITERNAISGSEAAGFTRNSADSVEDAPWSAAINAGDAYGYAIFDVDPGQRPGETTITFKYFAIPAVSDETGPLHTGTTTLPTTPFETFVFGRGISGQQHEKHDHDKKAVRATTA